MGKDEYLVAAKHRQGVKAEGSRLGELGQRPMSSGPAHLHGWTDLREISTGVVLVPSGSCAP